jgi:hypothetical protein
MVGVLLNPQNTLQFWKKNLNGKINICWAHLKKIPRVNALGPRQYRGGCNSNESFYVPQVAAFQPDPAAGFICVYVTVAWGD